MTQPNDWRQAKLRVCIDLVQEARAQGRVYSCRLAQPMPFFDLGNLVLQLDSLFDAQNFPRAYMKTRSFQPTAETREAPEGNTEERIVAAARGGLTTFELYVFTRRHASWQGEVDFLDGNDPAAFNSTLALLKLLGKYLSGFRKP